MGRRLRGGVEGGSAARRGAMRRGCVWVTLCREQRLSEARGSISFDIARSAPRWSHRRCRGGPVGRLRPMRRRGQRGCTGMLAPDESYVMNDDIEVIGLSRIHIREAHRSATRAAEAAAAGLRDEEAGATAAAILLAGASTEALLSELATVLPLTQDERRRVRDDRRASMKEKYLRFADALQGKTERGVISRAELQARQEYRALHCLAQLRNAVAHRKARFLRSGDWPDELKPCRGQIPYQRSGIHHWTRSACPCSGRMGLAVG